MLDCVLTIYSQTDCCGKALAINGPAFLNDMYNLSAGGFRSGALIRSLRTGNGCWLVIYPKDGFRGEYTTVPPNSILSDTLSAGLAIGSMLLRDSPPELEMGV